MPTASSSGTAATLPHLATLPWTLPLHALHAGLQGLGVAPGTLSQPINGGWTFGNVVVSTANSSSPETEMAIVGKVSYGRQLGRVLDALGVLAEHLPGDARDHPALQALDTLREEIDALKTDVCRQRAARMKDDLAHLAKTDAAAYGRLRAELLAALRD